MKKFFLKVFFFYAKSMLFFYVVFNFSTPQIADPITSEKLTQPEGHRITQVLAPQYDCSKQYNPRQFTLTRV